MLLIIAGPLIAAYVAEFAMSLTTKAIVGRLGYLELAGIGLASDSASEILVVLAGLLSVVGVLVAQAEGAGRKQEAGLATRQGLIVATVLGVIASVFIWHLDSVLALTGQDPEIIALMGPYLKPLSGAVLPMLWFFTLRTFVASLAKTGAVMVITVIAVGLNYVLCVGLVEGAYGLPALGVAGAGWAKAIVSVFMLLALLAYAYLTPIFRGYGVFHGRLKLDLGVCREILRLGIPVAGIMVLEASLFAAVSIFSGILGAIPLATCQVIFAWIGIAFVTAHGLAEAGMVRVAHGVGRGNLAAARQAGLLTFGMGVAWLTMLSAVPLNFPEPLVRVFLDPSDPGFEQVLALTTRLLVLAAFFQIFDGLQVMASLALRGMKDAIVPLWLAALGYWVLGAGGGWLLAFPMGLGAEGLWWGLAIGLTVTGSLLAARFVLLTAGSELPGVRKSV
ncbi:MAG TPA: MATE family efflux transporter [Thermohalobaculum sp.]|nr:MATE family efflux transporter [Thermohalobaculum sp.]